MGEQLVAAHQTHSCRGLQARVLGAPLRLAPVNVDVLERMVRAVAASDDLAGQKVHREDELHGDDG